MAIDYGDVRVGIAISDPLKLTAQAQPFISNTPDLLQNIQSIVDEKDVEKILVGLPTNREGQDTIQTQKVRMFKEELSKQFSGPIEYIDERYSSKAVERHLIDVGMRREKRKLTIDSQAAAFILQGYLDRKD